MASLKSDSLVTFIGQSLKAFFQAITFIILARELGPIQFGSLVSVIALGSLISPFIDFGSYHVTIKRITDEINSEKVILDVLGLLAFCIPFGLALLVSLTSILYDLHFLIPLIVGLNVLCADKLVALFFASNVAVGDFKAVSKVEVLVSASRAFLVIILLLLGGGINTWLLFLFVHSVAWSAYVLSEFGKSRKPDDRTINYRSLIRSGLPFTLSQAGVNFNQDLDKIFLARMTGAAELGFYAAALRVLNIVLIPIYSFYMAAYPRFFRAAKEKVNKITLVKKMLLPSILIGLTSSAIIYLCAPFIPYVLGDDYLKSVVLIQLAALIPIIQTISTPFADTLTGYGKQNLRVFSLCIAIVVNVVVNLILIKTYAAFGALIASIVSNIVFTIFCVVFTYMEESS